SNIDSRRYELKIETNPFYFPEGGDGSPTIAPANSDWVTLPPTAQPSSVPSDAPSLIPTQWDIALNGGCRLGHTLYEVHMYDSWGDGWDETMLVISGLDDQDPNVVLPSNFMKRTVTNRNGGMTVAITRTVDLDDQNAFVPEETKDIDPLGVIFQGGLDEGSHSVAQVCLLPRRCYQVTAGGGEFENEVSWDIRPANLESDEPVEPVLGGGAPSGCTMSLPDENGHHFCANTCSDTLPPSAQPPKLLGNLQSNPAVGSSAINEATGEEVATGFGTTRAKMRGNGDGTIGSRTSELAGNFRSYGDEDENN
ncbi:MAG: hypothetical protein SGILL_006907, partial [Bacillariaceae sp.]